MSIIDGTSRAGNQLLDGRFLTVVRQRQDEYFETQETLTLYKRIHHETTPQEFEITKSRPSRFLE